MKNTIISAFALTAILTASTAFAGSCPRDMKQIDAAMASSTLSMTDMETAKALRAKGEKLHKSGDLCLCRRTERSQGHSRNLTSVVQPLEDSATGKQEPQLKRETQYPLAYGFMRKDSNSPV